jgi:hypothetical protein
MLISFGMRTYERDNLRRISVGGVVLWLVGCFVVALVALVFVVVIDRRAEARMLQIADRISLLEQRLVISDRSPRRHHADVE